MLCEDPVLRALVVDDDPLLLDLAARLFADDGFAVSRAASAEEALALVWPSPPDVLFTDVVLPGGSGIELAAALRARHPSLAVVLTTGHTGADVRRAIDETGHRLATKPYDAATIRRLVTAALNAPRTEPVPQP